MSWLPPVVTVTPASEPITLAEAKAQCRVDGSDSDTELTAMIAAARAFVEDYTGTKLVEQTVQLRCRCFRDLLDLPIAPLLSVTGIEYSDADGATQTLATTVYQAVLHGLEPHIRLKVNQSWPSLLNVSDAITVTAVAGYDETPAPIKQAMLLMLADWFDNRTVGGLPEGAKALLTNYRRF